MEYAAIKTFLGKNCAEETLSKEYYNCIFLTTHKR